VPKYNQAPRDVKGKAIFFAECSGLQHFEQLIGQGCDRHVDCQKWPDVG
jgi:hypothetical protein